MAGSFGFAVLATVRIQRTSHYASSATAKAEALQQAPDIAHARLLGLHDPFLAAVFVGLIGVAFGFMIRDEDAAVTIRRKVGAAPEEAITIMQQEPDAAWVA
jgi:hypothetical protein